MSRDLQDLFEREIEALDEYVTIHSTVRKVELCLLYLRHVKEASLSVACSMGRHRVWEGR